MNRRIRKKKGLLKDSHYDQLKKELFEAMEENAAILEHCAVLQKSTGDE